LEDEDIPNKNLWIGFQEQCKKEVEQDLINAAEQFEEINLLESAADCYYEALLYSETLKRYLAC
jgi:hypothetical protein